jgi:SAM-dependent methyltransferase
MSPPPAVPPRIFDRKLLRRRRDRIARAADPQRDFLFAESGERLLDRLDDVRRSFPLALDLGSRDGLLGRLLGGRGGVETLVQGDLSFGLLQDARRPALQLDEEALPFAAETFDLVMANLSLHWTNDLPGVLAQIRHALKPDGLFLGVLFGAGTLSELRTVLMEAEIAETGGASARVAPFADLRDAAGLMQRAGFALPVADIETVTVTYAGLMPLMADLRAMGETNILDARLKRPTRRAVIARAAALYQERFAGPDGRIPASFRLIFLTGWAPHESQQQPARRGSGQISFGHALGSPRESNNSNVRPGGSLLCPEAGPELPEELGWPRRCSGGSLGPPSPPGPTGPLSPLNPLFPPLPSVAPSPGPSTLSLLVRSLWASTMPSLTLVSVVPSGWTCTVTSVPRSTSVAVGVLMTVLPLGIPPVTKRSVPTEIRSKALPSAFCGSNTKASIRTLDLAPRASVESSTKRIRAALSATVSSSSWKTTVSPRRLTVWLPCGATP